MAAPDGRRFVVDPTGVEQPRRSGHPVPYSSTDADPVHRQPVALTSADKQGCLASGDIRWTTPSGRQYTTEPTRHPI
jgi:hypothetical protein